MESGKYITRIQSAVLTTTLFLIIGCLFVPEVWAQTWQYVNIAPPGSRSSQAFGINDHGEVVGAFTDQNFVTHGFLLSEGEFTVIDFPGAAGTIARGISPSGNIVGTYWLPGDPVGLASRGFRLTPHSETVVSGAYWLPGRIRFRGSMSNEYGRFASVSYPGHTWEVLQRILPDGTILGCYHDFDQMETMRGIVIGQDGPSEIEAFGSMNNGATPDLRLIVGFWFNMMDNRQESYTIEDGVFTSFMVPGSNLTNAWDVNPNGEIVGVQRIGTAVRGFLKFGEAYTTIHFPGGAATRAFGINIRGDIVGSYTVAGVTHAFLARVVED